MLTRAGIEGLFWVIKTCFKVLGYLTKRPEAKTKNRYYKEALMHIELALTMAGFE